MCITYIHFFTVGFIGSSNPYIYIYIYVYTHSITSTSHMVKTGGNKMKTHVGAAWFIETTHVNTFHLHTHACTSITSYHYNCLVVALHVCYTCLHTACVFIIIIRLVSSSTAEPCLHGVCDYTRCMHAESVLLCIVYTQMEVIHPHETVHVPVQESCM